MPRLAVGGNQLLQLTRPVDLEFLAARGRREHFIRGDVLSHAYARMDIIYFVEAGIASVVKRHDGRRSTEICLLGREGFTGAAVLLADGTYGCAEAESDRLLVQMRARSATGSS